MSIQAIFFDLGGTLTREASLAQCLAELAGAPIISHMELNEQQLVQIGQQVERHISSLYTADQFEQPDWRVVWKNAAEDSGVRLGDNDVEQLCRAHLGQFVASCELQPYGIPLLTGLMKTNIPLGLVSNMTGPAELFTSDLHAKGLADFFQVVVWSSAIGYRKPDPRIFQAAMAALDVKPGKHVFMVGDNEQSDVKGARQMGLTAVKAIQDEDNKESAADYRVVGDELLSFFQQLV